MREILFRGKRKDNGEWQYGCLLVYGKRCFIIPSEELIESEVESRFYWHLLEKHYEAGPDTVGQFTGLTDKNGKKIFEGDIVNAVIVRDLGGGTENREETGIIGYDKIGMIGLIVRYAGTIPVWSDFFQELTLSGCINDFWFEVIGNIHDNPELLED